MAKTTCDECGAVLYGPDELTEWVLTGEMLCDECLADNLRNLDKYDYRRMTDARVVTAED